MLDPIDIRLLEAIQRDAQLTSNQLGEVLHLSPSQAGRRRQRLEAEGYITAYRAQLDPDKLGLKVEAFIQITTATHDPDIAARFITHMNNQAEITAVWILTGEADYLLRVFCPDLGALNTLVHQVLLPHPAVSRVHSQIVMNRVKTDGPLPAGLL